MHRDSLKLQSHIGKAERRSIKPMKMDLINSSDKAITRRLNNMRLKANKNKNKIQKQKQKKDTPKAPQSTTNTVDGSPDCKGSAGTV